MATIPWPPCRGHNGMQLPNFRPNRSILERVIAFPTFPIWWPSAILNLKNIILVTWLSLSSKIDGLCQISWKLDHPHRFQTPITMTTAKCSMRGCYATAVTMATLSWTTCRGDDGMRLPKFRSNLSICRRVIAFPKFSNIAAVRHIEF